MVRRARLRGARSEGALLLLLPLVALLACGPPETARPEEPPGSGGEQRASGPEQRPDEPRRDARDLSTGARFSALVEAARTQDQRRDQDSSEGCLVRVSPNGIRLTADLAVAVRPLPDAPDDLDARLSGDRGPVRVLTRSGAYGTAPATLGLVSIATTLPPSRGVALALFLTDQGLYARRTDRAEGEPSASVRRWVLERAAWDQIDLVVLVPEAGRPVGEVIELLEALPSELAGRISLATPLAEGTRLPEAPALDPEAPPPVEVCTGGLPELPEEAPLGELAAEQIRAGLGPLRSAAELCVGTSNGPGAAGGRVVIDVRIDPEGRVPAACVSEDGTGDGALRACLTEAARQLVFDPPGGFVDFQLPLSLAPGVAHQQRAVCR